MAKKRVKIPPKIEAEILVKSHVECFCGKRGDNIHHIDGDPSNNHFDNLMLLCYDHHHEATLIGGLKKKFTPVALKKLRNQHYKKFEEKRSLELKHYGKTLRKITDETLFKAALDAHAIIEIKKLEYEIDRDKGWEKTQEILNKLFIYRDIKSQRISAEVISLLDNSSDYARSGMPSSFAYQIFSTISGFFPFPETNSEKFFFDQYAKQANGIAFGVIYDSFIYLNNFSVASWGLQILKLTYQKAEYHKRQIIQNDVLEKYRDLEYTLNRPERNDLENAKRFIRVYKEDLKTKGLFVPENLPSDLFHLMDLGR